MKAGNTQTQGGGMDKPGRMPYKVQASKRPKGV